MNELTRSGASPGNKQGRFAPIWVGSLRSGLVTNRSPLIGSTAPRLMEKFYGTSGDLMITGSNTEISSRFTLMRRPGNTAYNGGSFSAVDAFYEFRLQNGTIKVIADTSTQVKDITGSNNVLILSKAASATQTYFQSVLNTLFMGDGVDQKKWVYTTNTWAQNTSYTPALTYSIGNIVTPGYTLIDANGNLQVLSTAGTSGSSQPTWSTTTGGFTPDGLNVIPDSDGTSSTWSNGTFTYSSTGGAVTGGKWSLTGTGAASGNQIAQSQTFNVVPGAIYTLSGYIDASHVTVGGPIWKLTSPDLSTSYGSVAQTFGVNGRVSTVITIPNGVTQVAVIANSLNCTITNATQLVFSDPQLEPGNVLHSYTSSDTRPSAVWTCYGVPVQTWGIATPTTAASPANAALTSAPYPLWAASTFYAPSGVAVVDTNNNIQLVTTAGITGISQPTWNVSVNGTTADGSVVWTNQGTANWQATHAYAANSIIASIGYTVTDLDIPDFDILYTRVPRVRAYRHFTLTYSDMFMVITAGTSGSVAPIWEPGAGTIVNDGTVVWKNIGTKVTWSNVGATTAVSTATIIQDSKGNLQAPTVPGQTGTSAPMWNSTQGAVSVDNTQQWSNVGPLAAGAPGAVGTAPWIYAYAYKNSIANTVSSASDDSAPILLSTNSYVLVQGDGCSDPQCDTIVIFRTTQDGADLWWLAEIPNPGANQTWTFKDSFPDSALNQLIAAPVNGVNNPPPAGLVHLTYHLNRVWGNVGNIVYYSNPLTTVLGSGTEQFPPNSYFVFPSIVTRLEPISSGLLVFTTSDIYLIAGQATPTSMLYAYPFIRDIGLLSYNCLSKSGSTFYLFTTAKKLISLDPSSGYTEPGHPIGDKLLGFNPLNAYLTWHDGGATDTALFLADGSTGWYRLTMNSNSSVESPIVWSPFATITGGCKAIQSVETSPGTKQLLIGPSGTGPVLKRDLSVFQDNGSSYTASATIGSIVLAEPGQMAQVAFIATDSVLVAGSTRPAISVIFDEALPYYVGSFTALNNFVNDPPKLAASTSLYSNRYYTNQAGTPTWCRHMPVQISWPAETFQNELLSLSVYGAIWMDK